MRHVPAGYVAVVRDGWSMWVASSWIECVPTLLAANAAREGWMRRSKHARTRSVEIGDRRVYLKTYHRYRWRDAVLEILRPTKAERALRASVALQAAGFRVPRPVACAVRRRWGAVRGAFFVAEDAGGRDLQTAIADLGSRRSPSEKWRLLRRLGAEVGALHQGGVYHGDLVPPNVRVRAEGDGIEVLFMDHDRTRVRLGGRVVSLRQARRNLVQLNRFVIPSLTATDRWRVFRAYCRARTLDARLARELARRVMRATARRRRVIDGVARADHMSFRVLMRTVGPRS